MKKLTLNLHGSDQENELLLKYLTNEGWEFTVDSREENIEYIKKVIAKYGATTTSEMEASCSPCISCINDDSVLVEGFDEDSVDISHYVGSMEVSSYTSTYEELDDETIGSIVELMQQYESDNLMPD
tara:strand:+ start:19359 stop:19739 length:381 start_codon:yes stop_codon:yes gene_type:complete